MIEGLSLGDSDGESDGNVSDGESDGRSEGTSLGGESCSSMLSDDIIEGNSLGAIDLEFEFEILGLPLGTMEGLSDGEIEG